MSTFVIMFIAFNKICSMMQIIQTPAVKISNGQGELSRDFFKDQARNLKFVCLSVSPYASNKSKSGNDLKYPNRRCSTRYYFHVICITMTEAFCFPRGFWYKQKVSTLTNFPSKMETYRRKETTPFHSWKLTIWHR